MSLAGVKKFVLITPEDLERLKEKRAENEVEPKPYATELPVDRKTSAREVAPAKQPMQDDESESNKDETPEGELLKSIEKHPDTTRWSFNGHLLNRKGDEMKNTNIRDLAKFATSSTKRDLPAGWNIFVSDLVRAGVPPREILNSKIRSAMQRLMRSSKTKAVTKPSTSAVVAKGQKTKAKPASNFARLLAMRNIY